MSDVPPTDRDGTADEPGGGAAPSAPGTPAGPAPAPGGASPPYPGGPTAAPGQAGGGQPGGGIPPYPGGGAPPPYPGGGYQPPPGSYPPPGAYPPPGPGGGYPPPYASYGPPGGPGPSPYASYGARLGGWLIDWLILAIVNAILNRLLVSVAVLRIDFHTKTITNGVPHHHLAHLSILASIINVVIVLLYGAFLCGSARGQTLGMMVVRARAVDGDTGQPIGFGRALGRAAFELLLFVLLFVPWVVDMLFPAWDARRQTLHDKVSRTVVVKVAPFPAA